MAITGTVIKVERDSGIANIVVSFEENGKVIKETNYTIASNAVEKTSIMEIVDNDIRELEALDPATNVIVGDVFTKKVK